MGRELFVRIEWPESQSIMNWEREYTTQCFSLDDMSYMVPVDLWNDYQQNPDKYNTGEDSPW